jgi:hypothetical protein
MFYAAVKHFFANLQYIATSSISDRITLATTMAGQRTAVTRATASSRAIACMRS